MVRQPEAAYFEEDEREAAKSIWNLCPVRIETIGKTGAGLGTTVFDLSVSPNPFERGERRK